MDENQFDRDNNQQQSDQISGLVDNISGLLDKNGNPFSGKSTSSGSGLVDVNGNPLSSGGNNPEDVQKINNAVDKSGANNRDLQNSAKADSDVPDLGKGKNPGDSVGGASSSGNSALKGSTSGTPTSSQAGGVSSGAASSGGSTAVGGSTAAAGGSTAAAGGSTAAAGGSTAAAGGSAVGAVVLIWVVVIIAILFLIFMIICGAFIGVDSYSTNTGIEPSTLMTSEYLYEDISTLAEKTKVWCDGENAFQKFGNWVTDLFITDDSTIKDFCTLVRLVKRKIDKAEETYNIVLSKGLVIDTILESYTYVPDEELFQKMYPNAKVMNESTGEKKADTIEPTEVLENILSAGGKDTTSFSYGDGSERFSILKPRDIDLMIEYQIRKNEYLKFEWGEVKREEEDNKTYVYYGCVPKMTQYYSFDLEKYKTFLRFGWDSTDEERNERTIKDFKSSSYSIDYDSFDVAGFTYIDKFFPDVTKNTISNRKAKDLYYAVGEGYEFDNNMNNSWNDSLEYCRSGEGEKPTIPADTDEIDYEYDDGESDFAKEVKKSGKKTWELSKLYFEERLYEKTRDLNIYLNNFVDFHYENLYDNPKFDLINCIADLEKNKGKEDILNFKKENVEFKYLEGFIFNKAPMFHDAMSFQISNEYIYKKGRTEQPLEHIIYLVENTYETMDEFLGVDVTNQPSNGGVGGSTPGANQNYNPGDYTNKLNSEFNNKVIEIALSYVNSSTAIGDCSSFVSRVLNEAYAELGIDKRVPSYSPTIYDLTKNSSVRQEDLQPGDLVFWYSNSGKRIHHVAIYLGPGQIIETNTKGSAEVTGSRQIPAVTPLWCANGCSNWNIIGYTRGD